MNTSIHLHREYIIIYRANKQYKCLWMMITTFSLSPIKQFCGEMVISLPNICSGDQSLALEIFYSLFCTLCGLCSSFSRTTLLENTLHTFDVSLIIVN